MLVSCKNISLSPISQSMAKRPLVMEEHAARLEVEARVWHKALDCYEHLVCRKCWKCLYLWSLNHYIVGDMIQNVRTTGKPITGNGEIWPCTSWLSWIIFCIQSVENIVLSIADPITNSFTKLLYRDRQKGVAVCKATARQSQEEN